MSEESDKEMSGGERELGRWSDIEELRCCYKRFVTLTLAVHLLNLDDLYLTHA